ncbi:MAG: class I SAM-dependent methyltransferase [Ignavibacteria bacterium]|nr:class I SAM-dependent methyltransferase [Ignavibacteria bacterium]
MSNKLDWYKIWFDSSYYRDVYSLRNENEAVVFLNLIEKEIRPSADWKILDFCCGAGRLSIELAERGYTVDAFDLSKNMLSIIKEKSQKKNFKLNLDVCDMRDFDQLNKYDLTINFFTSFGYFTAEENDKVLSNMVNSLRENGWLVLDFFNSEHIKNSLVESEESERLGLKIIQKRWIEGNRINKEIIIRKNGNSDTFFESVHMYSKGDLVKMLELRNMRIHKLFGDYSGSNFNSKSPRTIIFAQK